MVFLIMAIDFQYLFRESIVFGEHLFYFLADYFKHDFDIVFFKDEHWNSLIKEL